ncbi:unnamed protein product [Gordionus sp. m RMFG-2023]
MISCYKSAGIPSRLEPTGIFRIVGKPLDGMSLIPWSRSEFLFCNFTCIDHAPSNYNFDAFALAESQKIIMYSLIDPSFLLIPIACSIITTFVSKAQCFFLRIRQTDS